MTVNQTRVSLQEALGRTRTSYRAAARACGISVMGISRLIHDGSWPARQMPSEVREKLAAVLADRGVAAADIEWPDDTWHPRGQARVKEEVPQQTVVQEIELMQMNRQVLDLFGLKRNPFINDVEGDEDVFISPGYQAVEEAIEDAIAERGFLALISPSGSGKTTLIDGILAKYGQNPDYVFCMPQVKTREQLTPDHLCRSIIYALMGEVRIPGNAEGRGRLLGQALRSASKRKVVLLVDDAHFASTSVLRQLKTFYEEKVGRYRLLAILLVGIEALEPKLALFPEIGDRIRVEKVPAVPVKEYLAFKLQRAGSSIDKIFDQGGLDAFMSRYRQPRKAAVGRPLAINSDCIRAMAHLYQNGAQKGERITREVIDQIPGGMARRIA